MRILGIDPGIARTGWGVIEKRKEKITVLDYGCLETLKENKPQDRLLYIYKHISGLFDKYKPDILSIEELFFNTNAKTALLVGQARGVVLLISSQRNVPVAIYTPLQIKVSVTGYGRAEKQQIGQMVKILLKLKEVPKPDDTSDALAVALTHAFYKKF